MTRSRIVALLLGAGVVAIGVGLAWRGLLPGVPAWKPQYALSGPAQPAKPSTQAPAAAPAPAEKQATAPAVQATKPQQEAALPPAQSQPQPPHEASASPEFDTVRVEPSGDTVVAGHGEPNAKVDLVAGNKVVAQADADGAGNFVMVPEPLPPGNYLLTLRSKTADNAPVSSQQNVAVSVPAKGRKNVVVALAEPGKPSVVLSDTAQPAVKAPPASVQSEAPAAAAAVPAPPHVTFKTAEVDNGGFYASGAATPGLHLRIYLNGSPVADVTAGPDGHWSLTIRKGLAPGHYTVRADALDPSQKVVARAEVPFDVPVIVAEAKPQTAPQSSPPADQAGPPASAPAAEAPGNSSKEETANAAPPEASANDAVVPQIDTATVIRGDSLWRISRKIFGHGIRYTLIYEANATQIRDPRLIYPGQVFVLPHGK